MKVVLPKKSNGVKTNKEDPLAFYYMPVIGRMYLRRLQNTLDLMDAPVSNMLEIGYGSGILFPSFARLSTVCHGLEMHSMEDKVRGMLDKEGVNGDMFIYSQGSILDMPYDNGYFDFVASVSTLEHLENLEKAMFEIYRVLKDDGYAVLSFPARNAVTDFFYRFFGFNPRAIHPSSHKDILREVKNKFEITEMKVIKGFFLIPLYFSIKIRKRV